MTDIIPFPGLGNYEPDPRVTLLLELMGSEHTELANRLVRLGEMPDDIREDIINDLERILLTMLYVVRAA